MAHVGVEQAQADAVEGAAHGGDLGEDVDAVPLLLDHPRQAARLALDPAQPVEQRGPVGAVAARHGVPTGRHESDDTPGRYHGGVPTATRPERIELPIDGMSCAACASRVERELNGLSGVEATVNFATEQATVAFDPDRVATEELLAAVAAAGYHASWPMADDAAQTRAPRGPLGRRLLVSAVLTIPVLLLAMVPSLRFTGWEWVSLALATPVVFWGGRPFHRAAWRSLRHGGATMDTLISVGTLAAWGWSVIAIAFLGAGDEAMSGLALDPGEGASSIYLEVAAVVTTFVLAGRYVETRAKHRAGAALRALLELGAKEANVLVPGGAEVAVPVDRLTVGTVFVVRPGERIATDGVVIEGASTVDRSLLTGESVPLEVGPGDEVAGATVNLGGRLVVRATRVGSETALAQIARLVGEAQSGKAPVQRLADRISAVFVPLVMGLSLVTLVAWLALDDATTAFAAAVAVLIVACPCALGLATPMALLVGTGRGAQLGILIRGPEVLESTRRVDTIVLDKTGTVTEGRMALVDVVASDGTDADEALALAGSLEHASEHPVARAIAGAAAAAAPLRAVEGFRSIQGRGVEGFVDGRAAVVGRPSLLAERGLALPAVLRRALDASELSGTTVVGRLGRRSTGALHRCRRGEAGERRGGARAALARAPSAASDGRQRGDRARRRVRDRRRRGRRGRPPGRQGGGGRTPPGRGTGGRHGRRRRERRPRACSGRSGARAGYGHGRRHRGVRPDPGERRRARRRRCDPPLPQDAGDDQGEPVLGVRLQRRRPAARGGRAPQPADRRRGDGALVALRGRELAAPAAVHAAALPGRSLTS